MNNKKILVLNDENGNDIRYEFFDLISYNHQEYVILLGENEDVVTILEVQETSNDSVVYYVTYDATVEAVFEIFKERNQSVFEFVTAPIEDDEDDLIDDLAIYSQKKKRKKPQRKRSTGGKSKSYKVASCVSIEKMLFNVGLVDGQMALRKQVVANSRENNITISM